MLCSTHYILDKLWNIENLLAQLEEHSQFSKIVKFGWKILQTVENKVRWILRILYTFVLRTAKAMSNFHMAVTTFRV